MSASFDLDLITTTPGVQYRLTLTDGTVEVIDNPSSYPDPSNIVKQEEPFVNAHIYTPNDYVGPLMDLCQTKRGVLFDMKYMDETRVDLHYLIPLGEIVYDFFDAIKSRSRGYASYDYEWEGWHESKLVRLDFFAQWRGRRCPVDDRLCRQRLREGPPHLRETEGEHPRALFMETKVISTIKGHARVDVADVLRGLAVMGIIILHSIEHFNFYSFPDTTTQSDWLNFTDKAIWNGLFFMFGGKAYAVFALLFGFSFFHSERIISACAATISDYVSAGGSSCYS